MEMIFGESKPEDETAIRWCFQENAILREATPLIAFPGAMMAVVLLTQNDILFSLLQTKRQPIA